MAWEACVVFLIQTSPQRQAEERSWRNVPSSLSPSSSLLPYSLLLRGSGTGQAGTEDPGLRGHSESVCPSSAFCTHSTNTGSCCS